MDSTTARNVGRKICERHRCRRPESEGSVTRRSRLDGPLRHLTDVRSSRRAVMPSEETEKIVALVSGRRRTNDARRAYEVLRALLDQG